VLAVLTILLLAPDTVNDFVVGVPGIARLLLVIVVYGGIGAWGYSKLQNGDEGRQIRGLVVKSSGGALAELSVESAREQILKAVQRLPKVISADATVSTKRGKAVITLSVEMKSDDVSLPDKQKEINRVLDNVVEKQLGLKMAERPMVHINLGGGGLPATAPLEENTVPVSNGEVDSPIERLGRRFLGDRSDDVSDQQPSGMTKGTGKSDDDFDSEDSGEFWEFLKSTSSSDEEDGVIAGSVLSSDDQAANEVKEPITGLPDVDEPVIEDIDPIPPEEDNDELANSSS
jgi:hypothetical protein